MGSMYQHGETSGTDRLFFSLMNTWQVYTILVFSSADKTFNFHITPPVR